MKKIINKVENIVNEMLDGMILSHPDIINRIPNTNVIIRKNLKRNKVALISGGGSGHEPAHGGFVGKGMLDAAIVGEIFSSPGPDQVLEGIKGVGTDKGVLLIVKNYTGDILNFEMAGEMADGIECESVVVDDDIALENSTYTVGKRGIAGTIYVHKIVGAKAEQGASLSEVKATALKVINNLYSMGMSLGACIVPASGTASFEIGANEIEMGLGIHGEPGIHKMELQTANEHTLYIMEKIFSVMNPTGNERVGLMVNGMGATPLMELYIIAHKAQQILKEKNITVVDTLVGNYMTSMEMPGISISIVRLDSETEPLLLAKADTIALKRF